MVAIRRNEQKPLQMLARQTVTLLFFTLVAMDEPAILSLIDATEMPLVVLIATSIKPAIALFLRAGDGGIRGGGISDYAGPSRIACITLPVHTPTRHRVAELSPLEKYGIPRQPAKVKYGDLHADARL